MPKGILVIAVILLVLVIGCAFLLSGRAKEQPTRTIEVNVTANAAAH